MLLTQEIQEKLKLLCDGKTKIVIEGINGLGDPFVTKGMISRGDNGQPVVYENVIFVDFGHREGRPYSEFVASFLTNCKEKIYEDDFIIARITLENGEVLFENEDIEKYVAEAQDNMTKYEEKAKAEGRWIDEYDPVSAKLMTMVGKPFRIGDSQGVLTVPPRKASNFGSAIVGYKTVGMTCVFVDADSCLESLNVDSGEFEFEVTNGVNLPDGKKVAFEDADKALETKMKTEKLIWARAEKIAAAKAQSEPAE